MKHLPDDLLRIILAFASPTGGARQLAARARTLDEEVEFPPSNEPDNYPSDWKVVEKAVAHTHAQLDLLNALRAVSTDWRNLISYGSTRQLTLTSDACLDLPPDLLSLSWTGVRTLPASLQTTTTLRVLEVWQSDWLCGPSRHYKTKEPLLKAGRGGDDYLKLADAAAEIARRDAVLRPLSLALPGLRILMHTDESGKNKRGAPCGGWWHARCGHDWTDPVFF